MSEIPFEARFKTFVKQKKNRDQTNPNGVLSNSTPVTTLDRYDKQLPPAPADSDDTENETATNLLSEYYAEELAVQKSRSTKDCSSGGGNQGQVNNSIKGVSSAAANRLSNASMNCSNPRTNNHQQNGSSPNEREQNRDGDYDVCEENNNDDRQIHNHDDVRPVGRRKHLEDNEDESDDSADEDEEDAEEGVYDLGTSNLFLD